jgi:hypothetical protein
MIGIEKYVAYVQEHKRRTVQIGSGTAEHLYFLLRRTSSHRPFPTDRIVGYTRQVQMETSNLGTTLPNVAGTTEHHAALDVLCSSI